MPESEDDRSYTAQDLTKHEAYLDTVAVLVAPSAAKLTPGIIGKIVEIEQHATENIEDERHTFLTEGCLRNMGRIAALRDVHSVLFREAAETQV